MLSVPEPISPDGRPAVCRLSASRAEHLPALVCGLSYLLALLLWLAGGQVAAASGRLPEAAVPVGLENQDFLIKKINDNGRVFSFPPLMKITVADQVFTDHGYRHLPTVASLDSDHADLFLSGPIPNRGKDIAEPGPAHESPEPVGTIPVITSSTWSGGKDRVLAAFDGLEKGRLLFLLAGLLGGLLLSALFVLLHVARRSRVSFSETLEQLGGAPVLGAIPQAGLQGERQLAMAVLGQAGSPFAEAMRMAASQLPPALPKGVPGVCLLTGLQARTGVTTTAVNLGLALGQMNYKVLLIDACLRHPGLQRKAGVHTGPGLCHYLQDEATLAAVTQPVPVAPSLWVIAAGAQVGDPLPLLSGKRMHRLLLLARRYFDLVLIDAPALGSAAEVLPLAGMADASLVIVAQGGVETRQIGPALGQLRRVQDNIVGFLVLCARQETWLNGHLAGLFERGGLNLLRHHKTGQAGPGSSRR
ncbi:MAG TPA: CpsD/CapB family tyrosine-protein kinase [Thiolinea sp.]|nr:CpsD/CapB family tyrosine-protein kinase [Thiolinea sp.]